MFNNQQYTSHVEACGSRTEVCEGCSKRVTIKDMEAHMFECVQRGTLEEAAQTTGTKKKRNKKCICM